MVSFTWKGVRFLTHALTNRGHVCTFQCEKFSQRFDPGDEPNFCSDEQLQKKKERKTLDQDTRKSGI